MGHCNCKRNQHHERQQACEQSHYPRDVDNQGEEDPGDKRQHDDANHRHGDLHNIICCVDCLLHLLGGGADLLRVEGRRNLLEVPVRYHNGVVQLGECGTSLRYHFLSLGNVTSQLCHFLVKVRHYLGCTLQGPYGLIQLIHLTFWKTAQKALQAVDLLSWEAPLHKPGCCSSSRQGHKVGRHLNIPQEAGPAVAPHIFQSSCIVNGATLPIESRLGFSQRLRKLFVVCPGSACTGQVHAAREGLQQLHHWRHSLQNAQHQADIGLCLHQVGHSLLEQVDVPRHDLNGL
mmetsp:Transcript_34676/g.98249  ORF Transcript_34676/g.98249 Transcript_34676/m.98249 type:complete len:289 (-) Transcript_34676:89-955(-)